MVRRVWRVLDRHGWLIVATLAIVAFAAGLAGWEQVEATSGLPLSTQLYLTLQLFALDAGVVPPPIPLSLEIARFLAPLSLAGAAIGTVVRIAQRNNAALRARFMEDHLLVVGLGDVGLRIAQQAADRGRDVVVVEVDASSPHVPAARQNGIVVVVGDGRDHAILLSAGLRRARRLIAVAGPSATNAGIAQSVLELQAAGGFRRDFESFIEIGDVSAMHELQALVEHERTSRRQEFFNLADRAGEALLEDRELFVDVGVDDDPGPVVVVGTSSTAVSVLIGAARRWALRRMGGAHGGVLHLWMLAEDAPAAEEAVARAQQTQPEIAAAEDHEPGDAATVVLHVEIVASRDVGDVRDLAARWPAPSLVVVAAEVESRRLRFATAMRRCLPDASVPIVVVAAGRRSLVALLDEHSRDPRSAGASVEVFAIAEELCSEARIRSGRIDTIARALHAGYRSHLAAGPPTPGVNDADVPWRQLPERFRRQNVEAAHALWGMLASQGYVAVPRGDVRTGVDALPDDVLEELARQEHRRWFEDKHPDVPPPAWEQVSPRDRAMTIDQVRRIPASLRVAGLAVVARRVTDADSSADPHDARPAPVRPPARTTR